MKKINTTSPGKTQLSGVPDGFEARVIADLARLRAREAGGKGPLLIHIARDDQHVAMLAEGLRWRVTRKREVVLQLLRGEVVEALYRELSINI